MPEKTCLTTAEILSVALSLLREGGSFTASALAARLGTSPRVIFRHCPAMDALQAQTRAAAWDLYAARMTEAAAEPDPFYGLALAHVRFARQEPALYRYLFLAPVPPGGPRPLPAGPGPPPRPGPNRPPEGGRRGPVLPGPVAHDQRRRRSPGRRRMSRHEGGDHRPPGRVLPGPLPLPPGDPGAPHGRSPPPAPGKDLIMEKLLTAALPWVLMALAAVLCAVQTAREDAMDNSLGVGLCAGMALGLVLSLVLRWDLGLCLAAGTLLGSGAALGLSETAETPPEPSHDLPAVSGEPVWLERLDGLGPREELALEKLRQDAPAFRRPSAPSRIAFVLSETAVTDALASQIAAALTDRPFRRAAFIGASPKEIHTFQTLLAHRSLVLAFFDDTEKAKAWLTAKEA